MKVKIIRSLLKSLIIVIFFSSLAQSDSLVDVTTIAGKTEAQVEEQLGKPLTCSNSKYGLKCSFKKGDTEIVFIDGKSDWITINDMGDAPYSKEALLFLGLPMAEPSFTGPDVIRWKNLSGLLEVSLFPLDNKIFYAYIKVKTR